MKHQHITGNNSSSLRYKWAVQSSKEAEMRKRNFDSTWQKNFHVLSSYVCKDTKLLYQNFVIFFLDPLISCCLGTLLERVPLVPK